MDFKPLIHKYWKKLQSIWHTGKLQHTSRLTYFITWNIILFLLVIGIVGFFFLGGIGAGYFASLVKDEPVIGYTTMKKDINNYEETTKLYFDDNKYFGDIRSDLNRDKVKLDAISPILIDAVIDTEDQNFYEHHGVVPKSIIRALVQEVTNANIKTGGSTLTQQLIKNQVLTNEVSFKRKAKEILLALRLENFFSKKQILAAYLNIIPYGRSASGQNIAGIQTAAQGVFGIDAKDLNLPQAAYLAGLPQSPSHYTPFKGGGGLKSKKGLQPGLKRMKVVLKRMYDEQDITKKEYEKALKYDIVADFTKDKKTTIEKYPYLTNIIEKKAKVIIREKLAKNDGYTVKDLQNNKNLKKQYTTYAKRALHQNGYEIHTTINQEIYDAFQKIAKEYKHYGPDKPATVEDKDGKKVNIMEQVEVGADLTENKTGRVLAFIGGRNFEKSQSNHTFKTLRSNGSTMKPLLDYGPAMELGYIQPATPISDKAKTYQTGTTTWTPKNYIQGSNHGIVSARDALAHSYNIPAVKVYHMIQQTDPAKNFLEKMGISHLVPDDHYNLSLALGQPTYGFTVNEIVNAYATFGNNGKTPESYMIDHITDKNGKVIYKHKDKSTKIFSPQTTYLVNDIMRDVLKYGTGTALKPRLNNPSVDWAGKTGTSQFWHDSWFIATNPNVTFGTWIGYDQPKSLRCNGCMRYSTRNIGLWAKLINKAAEIKPDLITPTERFKQPEGVVSKSYCAISGMKPSKLCKRAGLVKTDLFNAKYVPTKTDDSLTTSSSGGIMFNPAFLKRKGYKDIKSLYPRTDAGKWRSIGIPGEKTPSRKKDKDKDKTKDKHHKNEKKDKEKENHKTDKDKKDHKANNDKAKHHDKKQQTTSKENNKEKVEQKDNKNGKDKKEVEKNNKDEKKVEKTMKKDQEKDKKKDKDNKEKKEANN